MRCKCGYNFAQATLRQMRGGPREYEHYAVINNRKYKYFLRAERNVLTCPEEKKLAAIARSAQFVGNMMICPQCGRYVFSDATTNTTIVLKKEDD